MWKRKTQIELNLKHLNEVLANTEKRLERVENVIANLIPLIGVPTKEGDAKEGILKDIADIKSALNFLNINLGYIIAEGKKDGKYPLLNKLEKKQTMEAKPPNVTETKPSESPKKSE